MALVLQFLATFLRGQMRSDIGRDRTNLLGGEGIEKWALLSAKNVSALDRRRQRRWTAQMDRTARSPIPCPQTPSGVWTIFTCVSPKTGVFRPRLWIVMMWNLKTSFSKHFIPTVDKTRRVASDIRRPRIFSRPLYKGPERKTKIRSWTKNGLWEKLLQVGPNIAR